MPGERQRSISGNMADMDWTFAEIIERCAYGCDVLPGDVIGSGTVGTGCFLGTERNRLVKRSQLSNPNGCSPAIWSKWK